MGYYDIPHIHRLSTSRVGWWWYTVSNSYWSGVKIMVARVCMSFIDIFRFLWPFVLLLWFSFPLVKSFPVGENIHDSEATNVWDFIVFYFWVWRLNVLVTVLDKRVHEDLNNKFLRALASSAAYDKANLVLFDEDLPRTCFDGLYPPNEIRE